MSLVGFLSSGSLINSFPFLGCARDDPGGALSGGGDVQRGGGVGPGPAGRVPHGLREASHGPRGGVRSKGTKTHLFNASKIKQQLWSKEVKLVPGPKAFYTSIQPRARMKRRRSVT